MTRVLVAAHSEIVRTRLQSILSGRGALSLVSTPLGIDQLGRQIGEQRADVLLLDLGREEADFVALETESIAASCAVVLLMEASVRNELLAALGAGVRGLLPRGAPVAEIVAAIEAAAAGLTVVHPDLLALLFSPESKEIPQPAEFEQALTPRETEILNMMAEGLGNKQIAWSLKISEHTVKFHISSIFAKLHVSSRTEAVTSGIRQGLIVI